MGVGVAGGELSHEIDARRRDGPHGHHHRPVEAASGNARETGDEHGDLGAELHVSWWNPGLDQGVLEGEAAAQQKGDQIVPPHIADVASLFGELGLFEWLGSLRGPMVYDIFAWDDPLPFAKNAVDFGAAFLKRVFNGARASS